MEKVIIFYNESVIKNTGNFIKNTTYIEKVIKKFAF